MSSRSQPPPPPLPATFTTLLAPEGCIGVTLLQSDARATPQSYVLGPACAAGPTSAAAARTGVVTGVVVAPSTKVTVQNIDAADAAASAPFVVSTAKSTAFRPAPAVPNGSPPVGVWADAVESTLTFSDEGPGTVLSVAPNPSNQASICIALTFGAEKPSAPPSPSSTPQAIFGGTCGSNVPNSATIALPLGGAWVVLQQLYGAPLLPIRTTDPFFVVAPPIKPTTYTPPTTTVAAYANNTPLTLFVDTNGRALVSYTLPTLTVVARNLTPYPLLLSAPDAGNYSVAVAGNGGTQQLTLAAFVPTATRANGGVYVSWASPSCGSAAAGYSPFTKIEDAAAVAATSPPPIVATLAMASASSYFNDFASAGGANADVDATAASTFVFNHVDARNRCLASLRMTQQVDDVSADARITTLTFFDPAAQMCTLTNALLPRAFVGAANGNDLTAIVETFESDGTLLATTSLAPGASMAVPCPLSADNVPRTTPSFSVTVPLIAAGFGVTVPPPWMPEWQTPQALAPTPSLDAAFFVASAPTPSLDNRTFVIASAMPQYGTYGKPAVPRDVALAGAVFVAPQFSFLPPGLPDTLPTLAANPPAALAATALYSDFPSFSTPGGVFCASQSATVTITAATNADAAGAVLVTSEIRTWPPTAPTAADLANTTLTASLLQQDVTQTQNIAALCSLTSTNLAQVVVLPGLPVYVRNAMGAGTTLSGTTSRWVPEVNLYWWNANDFALAPESGITVLPFQGSAAETLVLFDATAVTAATTKTVDWLQRIALGTSVKDAASNLTFTSITAVNGIIAVQVSVTDAALSPVPGNFLLDVCAVRGFTNCIPVAGTGDAPQSRCAGYFLNDVRGEQCRDKCGVNAGANDDQTKKACDSMVNTMCGGVNPSPAQRAAPECSCALSMPLFDTNKNDVSSTVPADFSGLVTDPRVGDGRMTFSTFAAWFQEASGIAALPAALTDNTACWWPTCTGGYNAAPQLSKSRCDNSAKDVVQCFAAIGSITTDGSSDVNVIIQNACNGASSKSSVSARRPFMLTLPARKTTAVKSSARTVETFHKMTEPAATLVADTDPCSNPHTAKTKACTSTIANKPQPAKGVSGDIVPYVVPNKAIDDADGKIQPPSSVPLPDLVMQQLQTPALTAPIPPGTWYKLLDGTYQVNIKYPVGGAVCVDPASLTLSYVAGSGSGSGSGTGTVGAISAPALVDGGYFVQWLVPGGTSAGFKSGQTLALRLSGAASTSLACAPVSANAPAPTQIITVTAPGLPPATPSLAPIPPPTSSAWTAGNDGTYHLTLAYPISGAVCVEDLTLAYASGSLGGAITGPITTPQNMLVWSVPGVDTPGFAPGAQATLQLSGTYVTSAQCKTSPTSQQPPTQRITVTAPGRDPGPGPGPGPGPEPGPNTHTNGARRLKLWEIIVICVACVAVLCGLVAGAVYVGRRGKK